MSGRANPTAKPDQDDNRWKWWALGVAVVLFLIIILQNAQSVAVNILFVSTSAPLIALLIIATLVGALIGYVTPIVRRGQHADRN